MGELYLHTTVAWRRGRSPCDKRLVWRAERRWWCGAVVVVRKRGWEDGERE